MKNAIAQATYRDTWAGDVPVFLVPSRSTRGGKKVVIYQWVSTQGGINAGGFVPSVHPAKMIRGAQAHPHFSGVTANT